MAVADVATETLRDLVLSGAYAPGNRLGEVDLAATLGMSRTPIRDALRRLPAEGLVEVTSRKGARVHAWSQQELEYVFSLRARLEGFGAAEAARRATDEQMDYLEDVARAIERHAAAGREQYLAHVYDLNTEFHAALLRVAGSSTLSNALAGLIYAPVLSRTLDAFDEAAMQRSVNHHLEIVAALRMHDPEWAESVMTSHLMSARASLMGPRRHVVALTEGEPSKHVRHA